MDKYTQRVESGFYRRNPEAAERDIAVLTKVVGSEAARLSGEFEVKKGELAKAIKDARGAGENERVALSTLSPAIAQMLNLSNPREYLWLAVRRAKRQLGHDDNIGRYPNTVDVIKPNVLIK